MIQIEADVLISDLWIQGIFTFGKVVDVLNQNTYDFLLNIGKGSRNDIKSNYFHSGVVNSCREKARVSVS